MAGDVQGLESKGVNHKTRKTRRITKDFVRFVPP